MSVTRRPSGLLLYSPKHKATERVVTLPNGQRARVTIDDSGTVKHIEDNDSLSATVIPRTTVYKIRGKGQ